MYGKVCLKKKVWFNNLMSVSNCYKGLICLSLGVTWMPAIITDCCIGSGGDAIMWLCRSIQIEDPATLLKKSYQNEQGKCRNSHPAWKTTILETCFCPLIADNMPFMENNHLIPVYSFFFSVALYLKHEPPQPFCCFFFYFWFCFHCKNMTKYRAAWKKANLNVVPLCFWLRMQM